MEWDEAISYWARSWGPETEVVAPIISNCSFEATPRRMGAEGGIWGLIHRPYLTRQSFDALDTLRHRQRLTGRGSVFNSVVDSDGREGCHARQREKRGVSLLWSCSLMRPLEAGLSCIDLSLCEHAAAGSNCIERRGDRLNVIFRRL